MTPGGFARLEGRARAPRAEGAARARRDGRLGGRQRRSLGERRLHLRQEAPARDRPPHPLPDQAARRRRSRRSGGAARRRRRRPGVLRRDGHRARTRRASERTVSIVGVDEIDTARGYISWVSPMARALLKAREGDTVTLRTPGGVEELEIVAVRYVPLATGDGARRRPVDAARARRARVTSMTFADSRRRTLPTPPSTPSSPRSSASWRR